MSIRRKKTCKWISHQTYIWNLQYLKIKNENEKHTNLNEFKLQNEKKLRSSCFVVFVSLMMEDNSDRSREKKRGETESEKETTRGTEKFRSLPPFQKWECVQWKKNVSKNIVPSIMWITRKIYINAHTKTHT